MISKFPNYKHNHHKNCFLLTLLQKSFQNNINIYQSQLSVVEIRKASGYYQEIPQSHTADQPMEEEEPQNTDCHKTSGRQLK